MAVYILQKFYNNNVSVIMDTFSSKKKADAYLETYLSWCEKDGWQVTQFIELFGFYFRGLKIVPPSGNQQHAERFVITKQEVK
jgi:hypothetical protein